MPDSLNAVDLIDELSKSVGADWPNIVKAKAKALEAHQRLLGALHDANKSYVTEDTSVVVFGSFARREWTTESDLDWTFLIDGQANSDHLDVAQQIKQRIKALEFKMPNPEGPFGNMTFSHELVHLIGGQADTNRNLTQRMLLLLESIPLSERGGGPYDRVIKGILNRYLEEEEPHLLIRDGEGYKVPRFLLNDLVRFFRTMAVDFASKQRDRQGEKWGLRNAKLRFSRKLILVKGLLACFSCRFDVGLYSKTETAPRLALVNHLEQYARLTPLEAVADFLLKYNVDTAIGKSLFGSYDAFLAVLDDPVKRARLKGLRSENSREDELFNYVREISSKFQESLRTLFYESEQLKRLTEVYGVF